eukprot:scaffold43359_cov58-Attheya_sp.AAC.1
MPPREAIAVDLITNKGMGGCLGSSRGVAFCCICCAGSMVCISDGGMRRCQSSIIAMDRREEPAIKKCARRAGGRAALRRDSWLH